MDLITAIEERFSVRHYQKRPVPRDLLRQVTAAGNHAARLCPEIEVRWYLVRNGSIVAGRLEGLASVHGMFVSAPHYLIAVSEERPGYMENLGFCMEQLILTATALGLGTCWIGGMFTEDKLRDLTPDLGSGERIVILTPLGYAEASPGARRARQVLRWGTSRQGDRKPMREIVSQDLWVVPWTGQDETLDRCLELTRVAPSWANTQPWHFVVDDQAIVATVNSAPQRGNVREGKPYSRLDGGIAMCHFYLAAQASGQWEESAHWRIPKRDEMKQIRDRYMVPDRYDILGVFPPPRR